jgi:hypothetical protein
MLPFLSLLVVPPDAWCIMIRLKPTTVALTQGDIRELDGCRDLHRKLEYYVHSSYQPRCGDTLEALQIEDHHSPYPSEQDARQRAEAAAALSEAEQGRYSAYSRHHRATGSHGFADNYPRETGKESYPSKPSHDSQLQCRTPSAFESPLAPCILESGQSRHPRPFFGVVDAPSSSGTVHHRPHEDGNIAAQGGRGAPPERRIAETETILVCLS